MIVENSPRGGELATARALVAVSAAARALQLLQQQDPDAHAYVVAVALYTICIHGPQPDDTTWNDDSRKVYEIRFRARPCRWYHVYYALDLRTVRVLHVSRTHMRRPTTDDLRMCHEVLASQEEP